LKWNFFYFLFLNRFEVEIKSDRGYPQLKGIGSCPSPSKFLMI
jgi:hypothetical protein